MREGLPVDERVRDPHGLRAAVDQLDDRVPPGRVEVMRLEHDSPQLGRAVGGGDGELLRRDVAGRLELGDVGAGQRAVQVIQVQVPPAGAIGHPDELAAAWCQPQAQPGRAGLGVDLVLHADKRLTPLGEHRRDPAGGRVGQHHGGLPAVAGQLEHHHRGRVGQPGRRDRVGVGGVPEVQLNRRAPVQVKQVEGGALQRLARPGRCPVDHLITRAEVVRLRYPVHAAKVDAVRRYLPAVG